MFIERNDYLLTLGKKTMRKTNSIGLAREKGDGVPINGGSDKYYENLMAPLVFSSHC